MSDKKVKTTTPAQEVLTSFREVMETIICCQSKEIWCLNPQYADNGDLTVPADSSNVKTTIYRTVTEPSDGSEHEEKYILGSIRGKADGFQDPHIEAISPDGEHTALIPVRELSLDELECIALWTESAFVHLSRKAAKEKKTVKRAFLVSFCPMTRVVVEVPVFYDPGAEDMDAEEQDVTDRIIRTAREQILSEAAEYINGDNLDRIEEDDEMPYTPDED